MFQGCIRKPSSLMVSLHNKTYLVSNDHPNAERLHEAYKSGDVEGFLDAFDIKQSVQTFVENGEVKDSGVTIVNDQVLYNGKPVHNAIVETMQRMMSEGFDIMPMAKFLENLMECSSYNSIEALWSFIQAMGNMTITEDGCFLAYKSVDGNYRDKYSHKIDNTPGSKPERMERNRVDDNPNNHCSHGYHVGALEYAGPGGWFNNQGDKVIICKINPADVVSVPNDHSCQKLRCCYYEPVGEFQGELRASVYSGEVNADYSSEPKISYTSFYDKDVDPDELFEGDMYVGEYTKMDGTTSERYFMVEEVGDDHYCVELMYPEESAGQYRTFKKDRLSCVTNWDGCYDGDEDEDEEDYSPPPTW